jgi:shikimate dehydrogenase
MPAERRRAAVLGHPIAHSLSPQLHLAAYADLGLDWDYTRIDVTESELPGFVRGLDESWVGLSLTMPLKQTVLSLLDEIDPVAHATGSANTVVLDGGRRRGWNTDVAGIVAALAEAGVAAGAPHGAVLGGGSTARSAVAALQRLGAERVLLVARRPEACDDVRACADGLGIALEVAGWDRAAEALAAPVVVSTVPVGVADDLAGSLPTAPGALLDVVYAPWPTALAAAWAAHGGATASGLAMLLHQAVAQVRLFTGREPSVPVMRAALEAAAASR